MIPLHSQSITPANATNTQLETRNTTTPAVSSSSTSSVTVAPPKTPQLASMIANVQMAIANVMLATTNSASTARTSRSERR